MIAQPPRAVLFDCDGVLVDSEAIANRVLRDDLAKRGLDLPLSGVFEIFLGRTIEGGLAEAVRRGARIEDGWLDRYYPRVYAVLAAEVEAVPGVVGLIDRLEHAGIEMAVGSNGRAAKMQVTLGRTGLLDRLQPHIYSAHDLGQPKPAPDVYLHAARQLGTDPSGCVVIEDTVPGALAARAAGMRCVGYAAHGQGNELAPYCEVIAETMQDLARHLGV